MTLTCWRQRLAGGKEGAVACLLWLTTRVLSLWGKQGAAVNYHPWPQSWGPWSIPHALLRGAPLPYLMKLSLSFTLFVLGSISKCPTGKWTCYFMLPASNIPRSIYRTWYFNCFISKWTATLLSLIHFYGVTYIAFHPSTQFPNMNFQIWHIISILNCFFLTAVLWVSFTSYSIIILMLIHLELNLYVSLTKQQKPQNKTSKKTQQ